MTEKESPSVALGICQLQLSYFWMSRKREPGFRDVRKGGEFKIAFRVE